MDMLRTFDNSYFSQVFPKNWDLKKIKKCVSNPPGEIGKRQTFWHKDFSVAPCDNLEEFGVYMGHEIAMQIRLAKEEGKQLIMILPVGPMGMYRWVVYFLKAWNIDCKHVHGFNMDEWSDDKGNTVPASDPVAFQNAMENAFYGPLGKLTVPVKQRNFATRENLIQYPDKIAALKAKGARQVMIYGIGRACHIAFWEPQFADEYASYEEWKKEPYRVGANLHPFTIEQNAITSFRSNWTLIPDLDQAVNFLLFYVVCQAAYHLPGRLVKTLVVKAGAQGEVALPFILIAAAGNRHGHRGERRSARHLPVGDGGGDGVDGGRQVILGKADAGKPQLGQIRRDVIPPAGRLRLRHPEGAQRHAQGSPGQLLMVDFAVSRQKRIRKGDGPGDLLLGGEAGGGGLGKGYRGGEREQQGQGQQQKKAPDPCPFPPAHPPPLQCCCDVPEYTGCPAAPSNTLVDLEVKEAGGIGEGGHHQAQAHEPGR